METNLNGTLHYGDVISLRSHHGNYLSAQADGTLKVSEKTEITEKFQLHNPNNDYDRSAIQYGDKISLSSCYSFYLVAEHDGRLLANRTRIGSLEKFTIINSDAPSAKGAIPINGAIALQSTHQKYVVVEHSGNCLANRSSIGSFEKFQLVKHLPLFPAFVSLNSVSLPDHYLRHDEKAVKLATVDSNQEKYSASFRMIKGLHKGVICYSFEATDMPGYFLRHQNYKIKLHKNDDSEIFKKDASFKAAKALNAAADCYSLESVNFPKHYIRHKNGKFLIDKFSQSSSYKNSASFKIKNALVLRSIRPESGFRIMLHGLECLESLDGHTPSQEPYIEVYVDGKLREVVQGLPMRKNSKRKFWQMPVWAYAENNITLKLWEKDAGGRGNDVHKNNDDFIGEMTVNKSDPETNYREIKFLNGDDGAGKWRLVYTKATRGGIYTELEGKCKQVPVRVPTLNQKDVGACVAFAVVGALTTVYLNKEKRSSTSKEELFDAFKLYDRRANNTEDNGWYISRALNLIMKEGIPFKKEPHKTLFIKDYTEYRRDGKIIKHFLKSDGTKDSKNMSSPMEGFEGFCNDLGYNNMRRALKDNKPLLVNYDVYEDFLSYKGSTNIYGGNISKNKEGAHAVFVIGYNNPPIGYQEFPTWTLQNSWGRRFGDNGLYRFAEGYCNFDDVMYEIGEYEIIHNGSVSFFNQAGYVSKYTLSYNEDGETKSFSTGKMTLGNKKRYIIPKDATNIKVKGEGQTGLLWKPWKTTFEKSFSSPPNKCFKSFGTTLNQKWSNNCN